jgi:hypothetical protein
MCHFDSVLGNVIVLPLSKQLTVNDGVELNESMMGAEYIRIGTETVVSLRLHAEC